MKFKFLLLFLVFLIGKTYAQNTVLPSGEHIDSICVNFKSLSEFLDVNILINDDRVLITSDWGGNKKIIYKTYDYDTIDYLFSRINIIVSNPPISDPSIVINDCCHGITISIYEHGKVWKNTYVHYPETYFPFAYAELYSFIRQILAKYWKKE